MRFISKQLVAKAAKAVALALVALVTQGLAYADPLLDLGVKITIDGTLGGEAVHFEVYDKDIHSGMSRDVHAPPSSLGGSPLLSDSYVIQGGDPYGGDTGDAFEISQSHGNLDLFSGMGKRIHLETGYANAPINPNFGPDGSPDTGFLITSFFDVFVGDIDISGINGGGGFEDSNSGMRNLPAMSSIVGTIDNESSNQGGFNPQSAPEPASLTLLGIAGVCFGGYAWRRRKLAVA